MCEMPQSISQNCLEASFGVYAMRRVMKVGDHTFASPADIASSRTLMPYSVWFALHKALPYHRRETGSSVYPFLEMTSLYNSTAAL